MKKKEKKAPDEYRIFVGAFPQGSTGDKLQALRLKYDAKTAHITPPHITLWGTAWRLAPPVPASEKETIARLEQLTQEVEPFLLTLGGIACFEERVVYLQAEISEEMLQLRHKLIELLGPDKHGEKFTPHLTIAMRLPEEQAQTVLTELQQTDWHTQSIRVPVRSVQLMQRGKLDPHWRSIARVSLGQQR